MRPWSPFQEGLCGAADHREAAKQPAFLPVLILPHTGWASGQGTPPLHGSLLHSVNRTKDKRNHVVEVEKNTKNKIKIKKKSADKNAWHSKNSVACGRHHDAEPVTAAVIPTLPWHSVYLMTVFLELKRYARDPQYPWILHPNYANYPNIDSTMGQKIYRKRP